MGGEKRTIKKINYMRNKTILLAAATILLFSACKQRSESDKNVIDKPNVEIKDGKLSPEALWSFGRIGDVSVSPDGRAHV